MACLAVVVIVGFLIYLLFKNKYISKANFQLGVPGFTTKLSIESDKRYIGQKTFHSINLDEMYVDSNIGFVIHKPFSDEWALTHCSYPELPNWQGVNDKIRNELEQLKECQCVVISRGITNFITYTENSLVNGQPIDIDVVKEAIPTCTESAPDQIIVISYKKALVAPFAKDLLSFFFASSGFIAGIGPRRLLVNPENTIFVVDCSAKYSNIKSNNKVGDYILNNVVLYQQNEEYFFRVCVNYVQSDDKPTTVWDDLRKYLDSFRVLVK